MSSTNDPGSRSAAEIEREVEQTRAGLTNTLDELRERASPGQLNAPMMNASEIGVGGIQAASKIRT